MRPLALEPHADLSQAVGTILAQDIVAVGEGGRRRLGKGRLIAEGDLESLQSFGGTLHLVQLDSGDIHEDEAAFRIATAIAGVGVALKGPTESQIHLHSQFKGIVRVDPEPLLQLNRIPDVSIFTLFSGHPVGVGKAVAAAKVTPLAIPADTVEKVETICKTQRPIICVDQFHQRSVAIVVRSRLTGKSKRQFEDAIDLKLGWFNAEVKGIDYLPDDSDAIAQRIEEHINGGAELILAAGVNSTDPLDLTLQALDSIGAKTEKRGIPAHPGSTCWLAYKDEVPIFGLALCGMFARTTVLDIVLCRFFAGQSLSADDLAHLGYGGLFTKEMAFRFPDYNSP